MSLESLSISSHHETSQLNKIEKLSLVLVGLGIFLQLLFWTGSLQENPSLILYSSLGIIAIGSVIYSHNKYNHSSLGIKNNGVWHNSMSNRGTWAWVMGIILTAFYVVLYWFPQYLGHSESGNNLGIVKLFDPLSIALKGKPASQWFVYGTLYTFIILLLGIKFIYKYRHNRYQIIRTISIIFFQTVIAFLLPEILISLNLPFNDFKNIWPLNYYFFYSWHIDEMLSNGTFGLFILFWGIASVVIFTPVLTYFYGKRWYCSWVCGCGGLAETAGDPYRQLSDKSTKAWKIERWMIHSVLVFVVIMTAMVLYTRFTGKAELLFLNSYKLSQWYGFFIGAAFSGVIGVGFYPLMGSRVWCRFGCPMAAVLGIFQRKKSKFRITTNGGQCISCGNCSTYCEMGIDVKAYAQRGQDIVRASCVGCGICSAVCPRGVLRLENGSVDLDTRADKTRTIIN
ncbi:MAG: 4Fe-4S binding protein [Saprospiraceae bacterium]|nr:4Fe-4S binding protein [Saprospiraceae bacterium]